MPTQPHIATHLLFAHTIFWIYRKQCDLLWLGYYTDALRFSIYVESNLFYYFFMHEILN